MEEPQPGLVPIIPRYRPIGPSPLIPIIVLVIVGALRWVFLSTLDFWSSFESDVPDWGSVTESFQPHFTFTLFLVPVVLLLAIHAFGIPQVNPVGNAQDSPFVKAITQNLWSSFFLMVVIMALLMSIPIGSIFQSPWQQQEVIIPPGPMRTNPGYGSWRGGSAPNGICQEIGILKRRCENWKGNSRDTVCRELASLQKRCERSRY